MNDTTKKPSKAQKMRTLWDDYAMAALTGLVSDHLHYNGQELKAAQHAAKIADAMMIIREDR